jgi:hypothetical protein
LKEIRMSRDGWRPQLESALCLDLAAMFARNAVRPNCTRSGSWGWARGGKQIAVLHYTATLGEDTGELRLDYTWTPNGEALPVTCVISLCTRPAHFGGRYWYMLCPYTGRPARKLYKFNGIEQFCHRTAIRPLPTYASQRVSGLDRIQHKRWAIRRKLGDDRSGLWDGPFKPKWMRWRTFNRYAERDAELAAREDLFLPAFVLQLLCKPP